MDDDLGETYGLTYRQAYGHQARINERTMVGPNAPGRDPAELIGRMRDRIARDLGPDHPLLGAVAEGIADANEGREPQW